MNLYDIKDPSFLKELSIEQLQELSQDIREFLINSISKTGGHMASNLGIVELTVALHTCFSSPKDKIFFDVGHQAYVHKILTGRANQFTTLRKYQGLSGFQKRSESIHDCFEGGHSSTTISAAVGMAVARDLNKQKFDVLPVIGDGSLSGGIALEALNHLGTLTNKVIVILNDNDMSISQNVGGLNDFLKRTSQTASYNKAKASYRDRLRDKKYGKYIYYPTKTIKNIVKRKVYSTNLFHDLGLDYIGPIDGHDFKALFKALNKAKACQNSVVVHVTTKKGKGYHYAEQDQVGSWHGVSRFNVETGEIETKEDGKITWSEIVANGVADNMALNEDIVTITPAMISGSKLEKIFEMYPNRSFDCAIAEQHATMFAAGLAMANKHPFLSIYSTFSQRSYDQFNHDLARMNLKCVVGLDRAGLVGEDGETHHGVFDIGLYRALPNVVLTSGSTPLKVKQLLNTGFNYDGPFLIRYPRGKARDCETTTDTLPLGKWDTIIKNNQFSIITYGPQVLAVEKMIKDNNLDCGLIEALFIKPLDYHLLNELCQKNHQFIVYETDLKACGLGSAILEYFNEKQFYNNIKIIGIDDMYIEQGNVDILLETNHLDVLSLKEEVINFGKN